MSGSGTPPKDKSIKTIVRPVGGKKRAQIKKKPVRSVKKDRRSNGRKHAPHNINRRILNVLAVALVRQIREQQRRTNHIITRLSCRRLCREIIQDVNMEYNQSFGVVRTQVQTGPIMATDALQEATEGYLNKFFTGK